MRGVRSALAGLDRWAAEEAGAVVAALDPSRLLTLAGTLRDGAPERTAAARNAAAGMARTAALVERYAADIALAQSRASP